MCSPKTNKLIMTNMVFPPKQQISLQKRITRKASLGVAVSTRELADAATFQDLLELHSAGLQVVWPRGMGPTDVKKTVEDARRRGLV